MMRLGPSSSVVPAPFLLHYLDAIYGLQAGLPLDSDHFAAAIAEAEDIIDRLSRGIERLKRARDRLQGQQEF